jgi:hypothetical protein
MMWSTYDHRHAFMRCSTSCHFLMHYSRTAIEYIFGKVILEIDLSIIDSWIYGVFSWCNRRMFSHLSPKATATFYALFTHATTKSPSNIIILEIDLSSYGCSVFVLYFTVLYYIQNCEYRENLFFEIMFWWFRKPKIKLEKVG